MLLGTPPVFPANADQGSRCLADALLREPMPVPAYGRAVRIGRGHGRRAKRTETGRSRRDIGHVRLIVEKVLAENMADVGDFRHAQLIAIGRRGRIRVVLDTRIAGSALTLKPLLIIVPRFPRKHLRWLARLVHSVSPVARAK